MIRRDFLKAAAILPLFPSNLQYIEKGKNYLVVSNKRAAGLTTALAKFSAYKLQFTENKKIICITPCFRMAKDLAEKTYYWYSKLNNDNFLKRNIHFLNHSRITNLNNEILFSPIGSGNIRGYRPDILVVDNFEQIHLPIFTNLEWFEPQLIIGCHINEYDNDSTRYCKDLINNSNFNKIYI